MNPQLKEKYDEWMKFDKNTKNANEIRALHDAGEFEELMKRLMQRMEFGTAGLRARMGAGYSMMNDLTIIQTAQGLLHYLQKLFPDLNKRGLVVGYDGRYNSREWAALTANIFLRAQVPVYLYSHLCPTPFVPFGVVHYGAAAGVMVTASHNPKEDNGYKVYWSNGAQIIPPHDSGISASIERSLAPEEGSWDVSNVAQNPLLTDPLSVAMKVYYEKTKAALCHHLEANKITPVKFVYTAMHGVGYHYVQESARVFGFTPPVPVVEQVEPDPEFPTVPFPNPEEGKSALVLAMKTADRNSAPVIIANDPDADRLAIAEKQKNGSWTIFKGNEIGALLGWWSWHCWRAANPKANPSKQLMLASTVSSKILGSMAKKEGFRFEETLTGFKWMGNRGFELRKEGYNVLFAFEEAIGFMCGDLVLDKDGISAFGVVSEMATYLYTKGCGSLSGQLKEIFKTYGYHSSNNGYYFCYEKKTIESMFHRLRNWEGEANNYPKHLDTYEIVAVRDLTTGYDSNFPDQKARLPVSSSSQMITFTFKNGTVLTLRTSGTEPKIKYYSEYCGDPSDTRSSDEMDKELQKIVDLMVASFYEPKKNNLTPQKG